MRIGIDARMLGESGIGRYIQRLICELEKSAGDDEFFIFMHSRSWDAYEPVSPRFHKIRAPYRWYSLAEQIMFPLRIARYRLDCMHFTHFNVPLFAPVRFLVTIHDIILLKHPLSATTAASTRTPLIHWVKYRAYRAVLASAVRRAHRVIAVSQTVADDIVRTLNVSSEKIVAIHEGADALAPSGAETPVSVPSPYVLAVGNAYPHKNLEALLAAFERMRSRGEKDVALVFCGQEDFFQRRFAAAIAASGLANVIHLGRVSDGQLAWLYRNALCVACPSLEEGFGLPGLEAMRHGAPLVASDIPVFREIYGPAALYFDPRDPNAILETLDRIRTDQGLREQLIRAGESRISLYSWNAMAQRTQAIYHAI